MNSKNKFIVMDMQMKYMLIAIALIILISCKKSNGQNNPAPVTDPNNLSFEADAATQTPALWKTDGDADADYTEAGGFGNTGFALSHKKNGAYKVYTYQKITGLENGFYTLTAWAQNGGDQKSCYLTAKTSTGERITSLPVSSAWKQIFIRGIEVTNGECIIGISSDADANNWCKVDNFLLTKDDKPYNFLKGGDLSELTYIEQKGGKFFENGVQKDCFQILKDNGFNFARLRLYNDPGNPAFSPSNHLPSGIQDTADILSLSRRAKAAGMQIQLTFHYSDYWTNPGAQGKPHNWMGLNFTQLKQAVYDFTYNFMNRMKAQGTVPEYVSLGNETPGGILFPDGSTNNFTQLAELLNRGYDAVKAVSPSSKVIIHLDDAGNSAKYDWFFDGLKNAGGKFDIIGASYYPFWTNKTVEQMRDWANHVAARYNTDIIIMETGYNWNPTLSSGSAGQLSNNGPYQSIYPSSPEGQRNFMLDLFNGIKQCDQGSVKGDIYWDPIMIAVPGAGWELGAPNVVSNTTLFDFNGNALPSLKAYKYNN
ncbi:MAG: glycosyl hydrolase 53 family protein [Ginsengibacter sp.]